MRKISTIIILLVLLSSVAQGALYVWVDKDGIKHMSNLPPNDEVVLKEDKKEGAEKNVELKEDLVISNWFPLETKSGFTISGEVKNNSSFFYKEVIVRATIRNEKGENIYKEETRTDPYNIPPDKVGNFKFENVNTKLIYLSKKNLRFDILNKGKSENAIKEKKPKEEKPENAAME